MAENIKAADESASADRWALVQGRIDETRELTERMDATSSLVYLDKYTLMDFSGKKKLDNVISVTGNRPSVFTNALVSDLMGGTWQTVVEGKGVTKRQASKIEQFIDDAFADGDEMLMKKFGMSSLHDFHCNHICIRGRIGVRWLVTIEDGMLKVDPLPLDMRWTPYRFGTDGLKWIAPITFRYASELQEEYPDIAIPTGTTSDELEVREYWDSVINDVMMGGVSMSSNANPYGKPPFVVAIAPSGFMLRDRGYIKHEGEDVLFQNRDLYKELNRSLSIEQSIGMDILRPPYEQEVDVMDGKPGQKPPLTNQTLKVPKGQKHQLLERKDLNQAFIGARGDLQRMEQEGGISDAELGAVYGGETTAAMIGRQWEIRAKMMRSRQTALRISREESARMIIEQTIKANKDETGKLKIGRRGAKNEYNIQDLGDPESYRITCTLMTKSKEMEIANWAVAGAARGIAPDSIIIRDILMADKPEEWERAIELQKAKELDPVIGLIQMALRYAEEAESLEDEVEADIKKLESMRLTEKAVQMIRLERQPQPVQGQTSPQVTPQVPAKSNMQGLQSIPKLLGSGGGRGGGSGNGNRTPQGVI